MEDQIIKQTILVRELQKEYFSTRNVNVLRASKKEEKVLDKMLDDYQGFEENTFKEEDFHPRLF